MTPPSALRFAGCALAAITTFASLEASPPAQGHQHAILRGAHSLDVAVAGTTVHLLVGEYPAHQAAPHLQHLQSSDGGNSWSKPVRVDAGLPGPHSPQRGMDAQIAAAGSQIVAVWMSSGTDAWGGGPMVTSLSADGGKSWRAGPNPADDGSTTGHGFIDIAADAQGTFHLTWFDTRSEKRGLRYSRSTDGGKTWSANATPDEETCECCWNVISATPSGIVGILYRDKGPRDMALALSKDAGRTWPSRHAVGSFDWQFEGCPHVGGGFAWTGPAEAPVLHATVWTGQAERAGVYHLSSSDGGSTWSSPHLLGEKMSSHPDLATTPDGQACAVWDTFAGEKSAIMGAISPDGGKSWAAPVKLSRPDFAATHPRVVATHSGFQVFWTEKQKDGPTAWKSASLKTPTAP